MPGPQMAQNTETNAACELKNKVSAFARKLHTRATVRQAVATFAAVFLTPVLTPVALFAQEGEHHDQSLGAMILGMGWPVANFIIFVAVLNYFLKKPLTDYLASRSATIRKDLVEAAELRSSATAQLATIEQKLQALPGELAALRTRGAEEITAEEQRIAAAAIADRERLLDQTRREIDLQVRLAKKEILEHAADLSVQLATDRIKKEVTPADQDRLVDRYLTQVKEK